MKNAPYVHGYSGKEASRLNDQAATLDEIIHHDTVFPNDSLVLEAGCGVGAQTQIVAPKNPGSKFVSVDISEASLKEAEATIKSLGIQNVAFQQADIFRLPFDDETFDSVIVCFVLEHLQNPVQALKELQRVTKPGGTIVAIEGDHGSTYFYPESKYAQLAINCQVQLQKQNGGNANVGRELYPLLNSAGLSEVSISPRMVYADASKPLLVEGFIKNTFTAMIEGIAKQSIAQGLTSRETFEKGIRDLYRTAEPDGVFCYTFFKGVGRKKKATGNEQ